MGITSDFRVDEAGSFQTGQAVTGDTVADPEISAAEVETTITYVRLLAPPARGPITRSVLAREQHIDALLGRHQISRNAQACTRLVLLVVVALTGLILGGSQGQLTLL